MFLSIILNDRFFSLDLKSTFDERSLFPKYILDYEAKQKQVFEALTQRDQAINSHATNTQGANVSFQFQSRTAGDNIVKLKRQSSSSTLQSDHKA